MVPRGCVPATQWLHQEVATARTYHLSHASDVMSREATLMYRHTPGGNQTLHWQSGDGGGGQAQKQEGYGSHALHTPPYPISPCP